MSPDSLPPGFDPSKIPLAQPPPGMIPNFEHPESRCWQVYLTAAICSAVVIIFITLRLYSRIVVTKKQTLDDHLMVFACVCFFAYCALAISVVQNGYGRHAWDLTLTSITNHDVLLILVSNVLAGPAISIIKLALFLLILHIFSSLRWLRILAHLGATFNILFYFSGAIALIVLGSPRNGQNYLEVLSGPAGTRTTTFGVVQGIFNVVSDLYLLVVPLPAVWGLKLPLKKRMGILAIFGTGLLACITSCLSLWVRVDLKFGHVYDNSWYAVDAILLTIVEMAIGIMVGCMPAVAALIRNRGLPFTHACSSLHSIFDSARVSTWSWLEGNSKIRSRIYSKKTSSKSGGSALSDQRKGSSNWESDGYIELMEARQPKD